MGPRPLTSAPAAASARPYPGAGEPPAPLICSGGGGGGGAVRPGGAEPRSAARPGAVRARGAEGRPLPRVGPGAAAAELPRAAAGCPRVSPTPPPPPNPSPPADPRLCPGGSLAHPVRGSCGGRARSRESLLAKGWELLTDTGGQRAPPSTAQQCAPKGGGPLAGGGLARRRPVPERSAGSAPAPPRPSPEHPAPPPLLPTEGPCRTADAGPRVSLRPGQGNSPPRSRRCPPPPRPALCPAVEAAGRGGGFFVTPALQISQRKELGKGKGGISSHSNDALYLSELPRDAAPHTPRRPLQKREINENRNKKKKPSLPCKAGGLVTALSTVAYTRWHEEKPRRRKERLLHAQPAQLRGLGPSPRRSRCVRVPSRPPGPKTEIPPLPPSRRRVFSPAHTGEGSPPSAPARPAPTSSCGLPARRCGAVRGRGRLHPAAGRAAGAAPLASPRGQPQGGGMAAALPAVHGARGEGKGNEVNRIPRQEAFQGLPSAAAPHSCLLSTPKPHLPPPPTPPPPALSPCRHKGKLRYFLLPPRNGDQQV